MQSSCLSRLSGFASPDGAGIPPDHRQGSFAISACSRRRRLSAATSDTDIAAKCDCGRHKLVRQSPCFRTQWPRSGPNAATKLNNSSRHRHLQQRDIDRSIFPDARSRTPGAGDVAWASGNQAGAPRAAADSSFDRRNEQVRLDMERRRFSFADWRGLVSGRVVLGDGVNGCSGQGAARGRWVNQGGTTAVDAPSDLLSPLSGCELASRGSCEPSPHCGGGRETA
jgi:hypothetical protein